MVEPKGRQQQEMEGKLQCQSCLTLMGCTFASLKVRNLGVPMQGTDCKRVTAVSPVQWLPASRQLMCSWKSQEGQEGGQKGPERDAGGQDHHTISLWVSPLENESVGPSVVPNSLQPHGLLCPWNSPGKNTRVGSHSLLQGIFLTQGWNLPLLLHWQANSLISRTIVTKRECRFL